jgi:hypothetical protein
LLTVVLLVPLEYTTVNGDVPPVMATLKLADEPEQIDVVPAITEAVGPDAAGEKVPELVNVCTWYVVPPEA